MIGLAKSRAGLYYLEGPNVQEKKEKVNYVSCLVQSSRDHIWLHHYCLGQPPFFTLRVMFPALFRGLDVKKF